MTCPTCAKPVIEGELNREGVAFFASFEAAADTSSAYLMLMAHSARFAPCFKASVFGDYVLHACGARLLNGATPPASSR